MTILKRKYINSNYIMRNRITSCW